MMTEPQNLRIRGLRDDPDAGSRRCAIARGAGNAAGVHPRTGRDDTAELGGAAKGPEPAGGKSARASFPHCSVV